MSVGSPTSKHVTEAPFAAELSAFSQHKQTLLDHLRSAHRLGMSKPFDADESWSALTRAATWYFKRPMIKRQTVLPARRVERLCDLAKALESARKLAHKAIQDGIASDLFRGWCAEANISSFALDPSRPHSLTRTTADLNRAVESLASLHAAASRAARDISPKAGPPGGNGILAPLDIAVLAGVYERSTGQKPISGPGAFARLVEEFLTAVGQSDRTSADYVVEALKYRRKQVRKHS